MSTKAQIEKLKTKAAYVANERALLAYELTLIDNQIKLLVANLAPNFESLDDYWELEETKAINQELTKFNLTRLIGKD